MTLLTAFGLLLDARSGRARTFVAINDVNRDEPSSRELIGCFLNFLIVRVDCSAAWSVEEQVGRCRRAVVDAYRNRAELDVQIPPSEQRPDDPLRPVVSDFWINFFPRLSGFAGPDEAHRAGELSITALEPLGATDPRWNDGVLGLTLVEQRDGALSGSAIYDASAVHRMTVERFCASYAALLRGIATHPSRSIRELSMA